MKRKNKGWKNEPTRHGLASRGVKTNLSNIVDDRRKSLSDEWIENRIERQPFRQEIRNWASEVADEIVTKLKTGEYRWDEETGEILKTEGDWEGHPPSYKAKDIIDKNKLKDIYPEETLEELKRVGTDIVDFIAYQFAQITEPIRDWLKEEWDIEVQIDNYRGKQMMYNIDYGDLEDDILDDIDVEPKIDYQFSADTKSEFDLIFMDNVLYHFKGSTRLYEDEGTSYIEDINKRKFKNRIVGEVENEIETFVKTFYNQVNESLREGRLQKFAKRRDELLEKK